MESLFARHKPRRAGVVLMLVGSLLVHGGLVGIGALLEQPVPDKVDVDWSPPDMDGSSTPKPVVPLEDLPMANADPTATPDAVDISVATPPLIADDPLFAEPSPTPRKQNIVKPTAATRSQPVRTTSSTLALPGAGTPGASSSSASLGTASWVMPHPPYPPAARRLMTASGLTTVRITTDASGRVSNVVIIRSAGNSVLDAHTVGYVRENWHGPANASRTTEFLYQLR